MEKVLVKTRDAELQLSRYLFFLRNRTKKKKQSKIFKRD